MDKKTNLFYLWSATFYLLAMKPYLYLYIEHKSILYQIDLDLYILMCTWDSKSGLSEKSKLTLWVSTVYNISMTYLIENSWHFCERQRVKFRGTCTVGHENKTIKSNLVIKQTNYKIYLMDH